MKKEPLKKKQKWIWAAVVALTFHLHPAVGQAKMGGEGYGGMGALRQLNLTADQKKKLAEIKKAAHGEAKAKREALSAAREALKSKMATEASDDDLRSMHADLQAKRAEMHKVVFDRMLRVRAILTPEQRKKFRELREKRAGERQAKWRKNSEDGDENEE